MVKKKKRRERRQFTREFKAEAVRLVEVGGKSIPQVARKLDLTESSLRNWVEQARSEKQGGLTAEARVELLRLRREVKRLEMEREIPRKAKEFQVRANVLTGRQHSVSKGSDWECAENLKWTEVLHSQRELYSGPVRIHLARRQARVGTVILRLRRAEFDVLAYLASNQERVVEPHEFTRVVLHTHGDGGSVRSHICRIRSQLRQVGCANLIETVHGSGYRAKGPT